jgi:hypothetical protein
MRTVVVSVSCMVLLSMGGCCPRYQIKATTSTSATPEVTDDMLKYYAAQGIITDPGKYTYLYENLPSDVASLCAVVRGVMLHIFMADKYGVTIPEERKQEVQLRTVERMLGKIMELDSQPLTVAREPLKRMVGNCRDHTALLCSMLKYKGIPARARCGFATYFIPGRYVDHWVCEYWNAQQRRWVRVDPQLDEVQIKALGITFNPLDLPPGTFVAGGEAWNMCRAGKLDPDLCGIFDMKGLWFVRGDLVRDFMALNRVEVLPWDCNDLMRREREPGFEAHRLLDAIADMTAVRDPSFRIIRSFYDSRQSLRMPEDWKP